MLAISRAHQEVCLWHGVHHPRIGAAWTGHLNEGEGGPDASTLAGSYGEHDVEVGIAACHRGHNRPVCSISAGKMGGIGGTGLLLLIAAADRQQDRGRVHRFVWPEQLCNRFRDRVPLVMAGEIPLTGVVVVSRDHHSAIER